MNNNKNMLLRFQGAAAMMSLSPGMSAGHAGAYFSRECYYLQGEGCPFIYFGNGKN